MPRIHAFHRVRAAALPASLIVLASACGRQDAEARPDTAVENITTIGAENILVVPIDTLRTGPAISGYLVADRAATIRAQVPGSVMRVFVEQGQRVGAGQPIAQIDDAGIRDAFLSARSGVASAENTADVAARDLERATRLSEAGAIAQRDLENARRMSTAAQAQLADARARLVAAQEQLARTRVTAPFTGVVSERQANAGDVVSPGTPVATVVDPSTMRFEASVPADQLEAVKLNAPVRFSITGYRGRTFTGRITRINPVADPATRQVRIFVSVPNAGATLVGGLFAEGRVASDVRTSPVVPANAVDERGLRPVVMLLKGGKVQRAEVTLGLRDDATERIEVLSGVSAGDTLLIGAARGITPGTPVRISVIADQRQR